MPSKHHEKAKLWTGKKKKKKAKQTNNNSSNKKPVIHISDKSWFRSANYFRISVLSLRRDSIITGFQTCSSHLLLKVSSKELVMPTSPGSLLKRKILETCPRPTASGSSFQPGLRWFSCTLKLRNPAAFDPTETRFLVLVPRKVCRCILGMSGLRGKPGSFTEGTQDLI